MKIFSIIFKETRESIGCYEAANAQEVYNFLSTKGDWFCLGDISYRVSRLIVKEIK